MKTRPLAIWFSLFSATALLVWQQQSSPQAKNLLPYSIPEVVQELAVSMNAYGSYRLTSMPEDKALYLDLLTAVSIMAAARAEKQLRKPTNKDYLLMFYLTCLPGDPPKGMALISQASKVRRPLVEGAYLRADKRSEIVRRMKEPLLFLDTSEARKNLNAKGLGFFIQIADLAK
jgi:hypothetical protein